MYCNECQSEIPDNSIICYVCGKKIKKSPQEQKLEEESNSMNIQIHPVKLSLVIVSALIVLVGSYLSYYFINDYIQQKKLEEQYLAGTNYVTKEEEPTVEEPTDSEMIEPTTNEIPGEYEEVVPVEGTMMPDFHFTNFLGETITLQDLLSTNKAIYITTFTTWCTYCTREMADMTTLANNYRDVLQFVFIDLGEEPQLVYDYHVEHGLQIGLVGFVNTWALGGVKIEAVPQSYVLAKDGTLVKAVLGEQSYGQIEQNIVDALLYID